MASGKRGGRRDGAGRPQGARSRATKAHKASLSDLARQYTSVALTALVDIAKKGESESARVAAANALLDRAYGKASQSHELSGPGGGPIEYANLTEEEIDARIAALAAGAGEDEREGEA